MKFIKHIALVASCTVMMFMPILGMDTEPTESKKVYPTLKDLGLIEPATLKFQIIYNLLKQGVDIDKTDQPSEVKEYAHALHKLLAQEFRDPSLDKIYVNLFNNPDTDIHKLFPTASVTNFQRILDQTLCNVRGGAFINELIKAGANVNGKCNVFWTMLIDAAGNNDKAKLLTLLNHEADINRQALYGNTALIEASTRPETIDSLKNLLAHSPDIDIQNTAGATALIEAAKHGNTEAVKLLLEAGADKTKTSEGQTALSWAAKNGHKDIAALLGT
jgi:ankyrin repeat protein